MLAITAFSFTRGTCHSIVQTWLRQCLQQAQVKGDNLMQWPREMTPIPSCVGAMFCLYDDRMLQPAPVVWTQRWLPYRDLTVDIMCVSK